MAAYRPPRERIEALAARVLAELQRHSHVTVSHPDAVQAAVRKVLSENLREEHEIEQEALEMLRAHGQAIYKEGADFQKLLQDGKKILAKKKGFVL